MTPNELLELADALSAFNQGILDEGAVPALQKYCSPNAVTKFKITGNGGLGKNEIYICAGSDDAKVRELPVDTAEVGIHETY